MKKSVFWDIAPFSLVRVDRRFRDAYRLHHQGVAYKIFIGLFIGKRPHASYWSRWEVNIKIDIMEVGWEVVN
jgi:hypothetical protein